MIPYARVLNPATGSNWEGVGVHPDVAISAAEALAEAHRLAIQRLLQYETNPTRQALLEAVDAELTIRSEANAGRALVLSNVQLSGTYSFVNSGGPAVTIFEQDGDLVQRVDGFADEVLVRAGGNRFSRRGEGEGAFTSFRSKDGVIQLLIEAPPGPPTLREKHKSD
jgi:hypothetical protein